MVKNMTSLSGSGLRDWYFQRLSALVLAIYTIILLKFFLSHSSISYFEWLTFITSPMMVAMMLLVLISLCVHAWVGLWTVFTDYVKCSWLRLFLQSAMILSCLSLFSWGILIIWSIR